MVEKDTTWENSAPRTVNTCRQNGLNTPSARRYIPSAGDPFADVGTSRKSPGPPGHWPVRCRQICSRPWNQVANGGISHTASCATSATIASTSLRSNAAT